MIARATATKIVCWAIGVAVVLAVAIYTAFQVSPWPSVLLIRYAFQSDAARVSKALEQHVPAGIVSQRNEQYDPGDRDAYLDVFYPSGPAETAPAGPTVVWTHGGGWVSGDKDQIANYAKVLAGKGFTVVSVGYSVAPGHVYPTPVRQLNAALSNLARNATRLRVNPSRLVLAGDSAGSHISAQLANAIAVPSYAKAIGVAPLVERSQLAGMLLYCGAYTVDGINLDGPFKDFLQTVLWSYSGDKNFLGNAYFATASVINFATAAFPPTFISAGNADPLLGQSIAFADALAGRGVRVERLFFPKDYAPALPHEYQFNLDTAAGVLALTRSVDFLRTLP